MALKAHHQAKRRMEMQQKWEPVLTELQGEQILKKLGLERALTELEREREWKSEREYEWKWGREQKWEQEREHALRILERERQQERIRALMELERQRFSTELERGQASNELERTRLSTDLVWLWSLAEWERRRASTELTELERKWALKELELQRALYGGGYVLILAMDFDIVWGNDARYWRLPEEHDKGPAELVKVSWLEVSSKVHNIEFGKKYQISFSVSLTGDAFGWSHCPIYLMAKIGKKGKYIWRKIQIDQIQSIPRNIPQEEFEIEVPKTLDDDDDDGDYKILYIGLYEVWTGITKGGLLIYYATVTKVN